MRIKNESYDFGKWLVLIFLPATAVFVGGLGELYRWSEGPIFVATINLVTIFLGSILQISSLTYYERNNERGDSDDFTTS